MTAIDIIKKAKNQIILFGVVPIADELISRSSEIKELLEKKPELKLTICYESETQLFNQTLVYNSTENKKVPFVELKNKIKRIKTIEKYLFENEKSLQTKFLNDNRYNLFQINLPLTFYAIIVDEKLFYTPQFLSLPSYIDYEKISIKKVLHNKVFKLITHYLENKQAKIYLSTPQTPKDKMLVMYDKDDIPRGIYPRPSFYNTDYQRYSTWLLIFNRKGEMLIHKRSEKAQDNGDLWDKSAGGHVDISDKSSSMTAEKELIEELYMKEAEYTKHVHSDTTNLINLGEWVPEKRDNDLALKVIKNFDVDEFGYFFIKEPIQRTSKRRFLKDGKPFFKETKFISDLFMFIAPEGELMNVEDMKNGLSNFAAKEHKLVTIQGLLDEIKNSKLENNATDTYTDDLLFITEEFEDTLLQFSEFIRFTFKVK